METHAATAEKVFAAERHVASVRLGVIALNVFVYLAMMEGPAERARLAYAIVVVALAYAIGVLLYQPYRRLPVLLSSYFTTFTDAALITLWIYATGGVESPFYVLWYVSLVAIAFRFDYSETVLAAVVYAACYVGLLAFEGTLLVRPEALVIRIAYILFIALLAGLLAREAAYQTRAKHEAHVAVQAARAAEAKVRGLLESVPDPIVIADDGGRVLSVNVQAEEAFGARRDALVGRDVRTLVPDADRPRLAEALDAARLPGAPPPALDVRGLRSDGREFPAEMRLSRIDPDSRTLVLAVRDVGEHHRIEADLRSTLSLLAATLESTADGILVVDLEGRITSHNRKFAEMWRIPEETLGRSDDAATIQAVVAQLKDPDSFLARVRDLYARPDASSYDILEFEDGRVFERYSMPQRLHGRPVGRVWSFRDVTEARRAEEERVKSFARLKELERLKELDRFKTEFINTAAHELCTPLTPIKLQLHMLRASPDLSERHRKALDVVDRNLERLATLVNETLEGARLQAGRMGIERAPVDLNRVVLEAVETFQEAARQAGLALTLRTTPGLRVEGDGKRLTQVLFNLLSNAVKCTPAGGRVTVETLRLGDAAVVRVTDDGRGVAPDDIPKLFRPFSQIHDTLQETRAGSGLGLYISKGIVELHGGRIWCESEGLGKGATFAFAVPLEIPHVPPATARDAAVAERARS